MADRPSVKEPYHLLHEEGVHGDYSKPPTVEESEQIEEHGNIARPTKYQNEEGNREPTGAANGFDVMLDNFSDANPEDKIVLFEFLKEKHPDLIVNDGDIDIDAVRELEPEYRKWEAEEEPSEFEEETGEAIQQKQKEAKEREKRLHEYEATTVNIDPKRKEKYATPEEGRKLERFVEEWPTAKRVGIVVGRDRGESNITSWELEAQNGDVIEINPLTMRAVLDNARPVRNERNITKGIKFIRPGSNPPRDIVIEPPMTEIQFGEAMRKVKFGGKDLPDNATFSVHTYKGPR